MGGGNIKKFVLLVFLNINESFLCEQIPLIFFTVLISLPLTLTGGGGG